MKISILCSHYKKNRDLIDMDYTHKLNAKETAFLGAFIASFYNGTPSDLPGSVTAAESHRLNGERRRGIYGSFERVNLQVDEVTELPSYRSARGDARKKRARRRARKEGGAA